MCESMVFMVKNGAKKEIMEDVTLITVDGENVTLSGTFGESKTLRGKISRVDSEKHEVYIE